MYIYVYLDMYMQIHIYTHVHVYVCMYVYVYKVNVSFPRYRLVKSYSMPYIYTWGSASQPNNQRPIFEK